MEENIAARKIENQDSIALVFQGKSIDRSIDKRVVFYLSVIGGPS
ncbi:hypothetical protein ES705_17238 [subsurface metagenome]